MSLLLSWWVDVISIGVTFIHMVTRNEAQNTRVMSHPDQELVQAKLNLGGRCQRPRWMADIGEPVLIYALFAVSTLANAAVIVELVRAF